MLFSCKFFWFVVCVSLPGSFANTDRAEWRVPSRYTTPAGRQPLVRCAHQRLCGFPPEGTLLACGQFTLSPHRPLAKKMLIQASLHRIFFPPVLPGLNARACFQSISHTPWCYPVKTHGSLLRPAFHPV